MTLVDVTIGVAVAAMTMAAAAAYSVPMIAQEKMRSATYDVQTLLQLAKAEAISRNRDCRFVVDTGESTLGVWDGMATDDEGDDQLLYTETLTDAVTFASPDGGVALTIDRVGSTDAYQTVFGSDGAVEDGTGNIYLYDGRNYESISVYAAGGVSVVKYDESRTDGSAPLTTF